MREGGVVMLRRRAAILAAVAAFALAGAGCVEPEDPRPGPVRAMEPRPNPPEAPAAAASDAGARVRRNPWLARFWEELTPDQRRRVERGMRRRGGQPPPAAGGDEARLLWDTMGLEDRGELVFGRGGAPPRAPRAPVPGAAGT